MPRAKVGVNQEEPSEAAATDVPLSPVDRVASLAPSVGNQALARTLASGRPPALLRQDAGTQAPPPPPAQTAAPAQDDPQNAGPQGPQPTLDPEAAKRLLYAQTVLSKVSKLPDAERANLDKMVGGSELMTVIEQRDKARADLAQAKTDLESAKDLSGAEKDGEMKKAQGRIDLVGLDLEGLQTRVAEGLKKAGVASEEELIELVGKFPETWKKRAKEIAGRMLDENQAAVEHESLRYDYYTQHGRASETAWDDITALRTADNQIAAGVGELSQLEFPFEGPKPQVTLDGLQADVDRGSPQPQPQPDGSPAPDADEQTKAQKAVYDKKGALLARWRALGLEHVFLFHPSYRPGYLAAVGDDDMMKMTGGWAAETKKNIDKTRENIDDETVSLWELRDVPDLAFDSLGVPRDSVLGKAVEKVYADEKSDAEGLRMAAESFALTLTVVATAVAGPIGLAVGAVAQGAVSAVELGHDIAQAQAQGAAQNVALDPDLAKMSKEDPDLFAVVSDIVALGLAVGDAISAAKGLKAAVTALEQTGDKEAFVAEAQKILGEKAGQLGDKIAVRARAFPNKFMQVFDDYRSAHNAYMEALEADPTREVGIWRNKKDNKYILGYGDETSVEGPASTAEKLWESVKHHHPGEPIVATMTDRIPSTADFANVMAPRIADISPDPVRSMITWVDEGGVIHYTTFGMDPTELERYWVRYTDLQGQVIEKRFKMEPWLGGKIDYENWIGSLRQAEKAEIHGAPTVR